MTDKEIVKALEDLVKCNNNEIDCDNCSLSVFYPRCPEEIGELSLDLINRLQSHIEKCDRLEKIADKTIATLQAENKRLKAPTTDWLVRGISPEQLEKEKIQALMDIAKKYAKAEAYKEFAERLIEKYGYYDWENKTIVYPEDEINNLLKELVGEDDG